MHVRRDGDWPRGSAHTDRRAAPARPRAVPSGSGAAARESPQRERRDVWRLDARRERHSRHIYVINTPDGALRGCDCRCNGSTDACAPAPARRRHVSLRADTTVTQWRRRAVAAFAPDKRAPWTRTRAPARMQVARASARARAFPHQCTATSRCADGAPPRDHAALAVWRVRVTQWRLVLRRHLLPRSPLPCRFPANHASRHAPHHQASRGRP